MRADTPSTRQRLLMCVLNTMETDGRVRRSVEALHELFEIRVVAVRGSRPYHSEQCDCTEVRLINCPFPGLIGLLLITIRLLITALRWRPVAIYGHDFYMALPAFLASRVAKAKFIYDAHELIIPGGYSPSAALSLMYTLEKLVIRRADLVIAANHWRAELMQEHYRLSVAPAVVRNLAPHSIRAFPSGGGNQEHSQRTRGIRLVYAGAVSPERQLVSFVRALKYLPDSVSLYIIGPGNTDNLVTAAEQENVRRRVTILGRVDQETLARKLTECDLGIVTYSFKGLNSLYCASNKLCEYACAGLPVISTGQPPLEADIRRYNIGRILSRPCTDGDSQTKQLATEIRAAIDDIGIYREGLQRFISENNWDTERKQLRRAITRVVAPLPDAGCPDGLDAPYNAC